MFQNIACECVCALFSLDISFPYLCRCRRRCRRRRCFCHRHRHRLLECVCVYVCVNTLFENLLEHPTTHLVRVCVSLLLYRLCVICATLAQCFDSGKQLLYSSELVCVLLVFVGGIAVTRRQPKFCQFLATILNGP